MLEPHERRKVGLMWITAKTISPMISVERR